MESFELVKCIHGVFVLFVRFVVFVSFEKSLGFELRNGHDFRYGMNLYCICGQMEQIDDWMIGNGNGYVGNVMKA